MSFARLVAAALALAVGVGSADAQSSSDGSYPRFDATLTRLAIHQLPQRVVDSTPVSMPLDQLTREKCDQSAIADLAKALQAAGYRREASTALVNFSDSCGGHAPSLRSAINILMGLTDYAGATAVASMVIKLEPFGDNGYFLRAFAEDKLGQNTAAIDDYTTAIELYGDKTKIGSVSYTGIEQIYERLGRYCDAILPIENWVAIAPSHDTSQTRAIIATDMSKGNCVAATSGKPEKFPANKGNVVKVAVVINGVQGTFLIDTGATFVSMTEAFAGKANIQAEPGETIQMHTANGPVEAHPARAKSIQLRSLRAADVPVAIETDNQLNFGAGVDGLLGMSFLARFKLTIDSVNMTIAP